MFTKAFTCAARLGPPARRIDVLIAPSIGFTSRRHSLRRRTVVLGQLV
jgi:ribosomal protein S6E (S10)